MWLYVPSMDLASVQESEDLSWPFGSSTDPNTLVWVTSKGTLTRRQPSWRGWKNRRWTKRLSGTISNPSQAWIIARRWISFRLESHVNPSAQPVEKLASLIIDGSGLSLPNTSPSLDLKSSSWRMSPAFDATDSLKSWEILPFSGSMQSGIISERPILERPIEEPDSSSWPTPRASAGENRTNKRAPSHRKTPGSNLAVEAAEFRKQWPTPAAWDGQRGPDLARASRPNSGGMDLVTTAVHLGPQGQRIKPDGSHGLVLNPAFVEELMGLPNQWSAATDSDVSGIQSYQLWLQQHTLLLRIALNLDR